MALFFLPEIGVVLTAAWQAALTAIGNGAVLSLGGDTSVRLKHRQGRWQRQVLVMETVKVQKRLITDIDLRSEFYYDSFIETHATPDESPIIAKSYTELLEKLVSNEKEWFWLDFSFQSYGDVYEDE